MKHDYDANGIERKWQERWEASEIWKAEPDTSKPKFFMIFAYPGTSGFLHVGHMRGYSYADIISRFKRMTGHNVLYPVGAHASGNLSQSFARKVERGDPKTLELLQTTGASPEEIEKLKDPLYVVSYLSRVYVNDYWKKFGFLVDWRRFMTTIDPGYKKFIQWQFRKLAARDLLVQKPYFGAACLKCGPVAVDASETDILQGGNAEKQELTLLKFKLGDEFIMAATLRPETVYGQTNFWVDPDTTYVRARVGTEIWIISREAAEKLSYQKDDVEIVGEIAGSELVGKKVIAPVIERSIPIFPSRFCDPDFGTGLVTSVPSDAPFDWIALRDLMNDPETCDKYGLDIEFVRSIKPIPIIVSKDWGDMPGVEICEKMGIEDQDDPRLEEATKEIYKAGFHTGRMNENCGEFKGMPVTKAKDEMRDMMLAKDLADTMYDLSEKVICRSGDKVIMKKIPDQWFIKYSDPQLTDESKFWAGQMKILPPEYFTNLPDTLDWFQDRACVRKGNWLGTEFPFDESWIIEPISDSTIYPAYYTFSHLVADNLIQPEQLTESFFDYLFQGKGEADAVMRETGLDEGTLARAKNEFDYWYPLDINLGGKEHMTVHFPVFLMNHVAVMPQRNWPQGILVNWYIVMAGGKVSKSKGGAQPIPNAAARFTVDGMRLYYAHIASPFADVEWSDDAVQNYKQRIERIWNFAHSIMDGKGQAGPMDVWLQSRVGAHVTTVRNAMDEFEIRDAANSVYFEMMADLRWYVRRGGCNPDVLDSVLNTWTRLMCPFTPHLAEELWEVSGNEGFASVAEFPAADQYEQDEASEYAEKYLINVRDDLGQILKTTGIAPKKVCIYTAPEWKLDIFKKGMEMLEKGPVQMNELMRYAMARDGMKELAKEVSSFAMRFVKDANKFTEVDKARFTVKIDELGYLKEAVGFLEGELECDVEVYVAGDPDTYDPKGRSGTAYPYKPAIYVE